MFDWPEASHTSPTRILVRVTVFLPLITRSAGTRLAGSAGRSTRHLPAASAVVAAVLPEKETETFSPASAVPQTGIGLSRWRTALSLNTKAGTTSARTGAPGHVAPRQPRVRQNRGLRIISVNFLF